MRLGRIGCVFLAFMLAAAACGGGNDDAADSGSVELETGGDEVETDGDSAEDAAAPTTVSNDTEDNTRKSDDTDDSAGDGGDTDDDTDDTDDTTGGDSGNSGDGGEVALADGHAEVTEALFGALDSATYDGRSQCLNDRIADSQPVDELGLSRSNRSHLLADGNDIWAICLIENDSGAQSPLDLGTITVVDATGQTWSSAPLSTDPNLVQGEQNLGYGRSVASADPVLVQEGSARLPIGSTYLLDGYRVTTLFLQVPNRRPPGAWTIRVDGESSRSIQLDTPVCENTATSARAPWLTDLSLRIVTFGELSPWFGGDQVGLEYRPVDHCLAAPYVVGAGFADASQSFDSAINANGLTPNSPRMSIMCRATMAPGESAVTGQSPAPNEILGASYDLSIETYCPVMADVLGSTVAEATTAVEALAELAPGISFGFIPDAACVGDQSVVTRTFPPAGDDFTSGSPLSVYLYC